MQTETSAFHHVSSSSWKKYLLQQQQQQDVQSVKSDKASKKSLKSSSDSKKSNSSNSSDSHRSKHKLSVVPDSIDKCQQQQQQKHSSKGGSCESLEPTRKGGSSSSRSSSVAPATTAAPPYGKQARSAPSNGYGASGNKQGSRAISATQNGGKRGGDGSDATAPDEVSQCCQEPQRRPAADRKGASKVKVCGSTQTGDPYSSPAVHSDGEYSSLGRKYPPPRQYFMTTPGPGTGLKERVYGSRSALNGSPTPLSEYGVSRAPRLSAPLRDMDNYATLDHGPYSTWMRHSPSCGTSVRGGTLTEADSMESLSSTSSSIHAQVSLSFLHMLHVVTF